MRKKETRVAGLVVKVVLEAVDEGVGFISPIAEGRPSMGELHGETCIDTRDRLCGCR